MLAVYDIAHSLPVGGADRDFPSQRMRPKRISHTSLMLLESDVKCIFKKINLCSLIKIKIHFGLLITFSLYIHIYFEEKCLKLNLLFELLSLKIFIKCSN